MKEKDIVHLVNLKNTTLDEIIVNVRTLEKNSEVQKITTNSSSTVRDFIVEKLSGDRNSDNLVLVHVGKQLKFDRTFQEEHI